MANLYQDNAYNVLGLDTSASQKEINKRAKEIINLLRIEEEPSYETDIKLSHVKRTESIVKDALQKLTSPTKRVREYFFWFDVEGDNDEKAISLLKTENYAEAIAIWEEQGTKETANGFVAKKNLAVLTSLLLFSTGQKKYLTQSIGAWKDILRSEKFLPHFEKIYALNDEVGTSKATIRDFINGVKDELSDFYTDVSEKHNDRSYYSLFTQVFAVKGQKIQRDVLSPIYEAINDVSEKLANLNISEDNIISDDEIRTLKRLTKSLQDNFDKLKELGLYEDSQSKFMRDKAAEALRTVGLDLYNNLNESAKPAALFNIAFKIAGTVGLQNKLKKEIEQLRKNVSNEKIIKPINDLLGDEEFSEALALIESQKDKYKDDDELTTYFNTRIQWCVTGIAAKDFLECKQLFDKNKHKEANTQFIGLKDFILSYLDYFNFNQESVYDLINQANTMLASVNQASINNVDNYRNQVIESANTNFAEQFEQTVLIILLDCTIYAQLSSQIPTIKRKKTAKSWIWWIVILAILGIVGASNSDSSNSSTTGTTPSSSGSSSSSSSSAYTACAAEYDSLKSQLDSIESRMNSYKASDDTDNFNALVPQQNSLVNQVNSKATECNGLR